MYALCSGASWVALVSIQKLPICGFMYNPVTVCYFKKQGRAKPTVAPLNFFV